METTISERSWVEVNYQGRNVRRWFDKDKRQRGRMEARVIWEKYNGTIPEGFHIHHKDGNVKNDSIENLEMLSARDHFLLHRKCYQIVDGKIIRQCFMCKKWMDVSNFRERRQGKFKYFCWERFCFPCEKKYHQAYAEKNRGRTNERARLRYRENPGKILAYLKDYRKRNRARRSEIGKLYRKKNREKILAYRRAYIEKNREKINMKKRLAYQNAMMVIKKQAWSRNPQPQESGR